MTTQIQLTYPDGESMSTVIFTHEQVVPTDGTGLHQVPGILPGIRVGLPVQGVDYLRHQTTL